MGSEITFSFVYNPSLSRSQNNLKITVFKSRIFPVDNLCKRRGEGVLVF